MKSKQIITFLFISFILPNAMAAIYKLPKHGDDIIGKLLVIHGDPQEDLQTIAQRYDIGYFEMLEANPGVDPLAFSKAANIVIPSKFILPPGPREGIVVNLAEMRLYYYPPNENTVITYPVGIGRQDWTTPEGVMKIISKRANPIWNVPESIRKARAKQGVYLPKTVPPGPKNPLGKFAMRLSQPNYLIHGTNDPSGVGRRSSSGCLRMYPDDIDEIFDMVPIGTKVRIINEPYKIGYYDGDLYLESHQPLQEQELVTVEEKLKKVKDVFKKHKIVFKQYQHHSLKKAALSQAGIPLIIQEAQRGA